MNMVNIDKAIETEGFRQALKDKVCSRKDFKKNWQNIHTPFNLCKEIAGKLVEFTGLDNKIILTLNLEFLEILCYCYGVKRENIWFLTDCEEKAKVIKHPRYVGVNIIIANYLEWKTDMLFDIICGNPPYNVPNNRNEDGVANGQCLWQDFIKTSILRLKPEGFLCFVHPSSWRRPEDELWDLMSSKQIHYLEIHSAADGNSTFGVGTRYDWYILQNLPCFKPTLVKDEKSELNEIDLRKRNFLPNFLIKEIYSMIALDADEKCQAIYDRGCYRSGPSGKKWMSKKKTKSFKFPCILKMGAEKNGGTVIWYSNTNEYGHFGVPKVLINKSGYARTINDFNGEYGPTQHTFYIKVSSKEEAESICKAFDSEKIQEIIKATKWQGFAVDHNFFKYLKRDFWKGFVK
jgi:hypothetical protein